MLSDVQSRKIAKYRKLAGKNKFCKYLAVFLLIWSLFWSKFLSFHKRRLVIVAELCLVVSVFAFSTSFAPPIFPSSDAANEVALVQPDDDLDALDDYDLVLNEIKENGDTSYETRLRLAAKVFRTTAQYDSMISQYLTEQTGEENAESMTLNYTLKQSLRYGENPHQKAALYEGSYTSYSIVHAKQIQGKELSYNNIQDANACLNLLKEFSEPTAVGLKHMNPCGVASADDIVTAWDKAYNADSVSIYGGIVAFNRPVTVELAKNIRDKKVFLEIIMAPSYDEKALEILAKKANCRVMEVDMTTPFKDNKQALTVNGGLLYQDLDNDIWNEEDLKVVTEKQPTKEEYEDLLFAMKCCKHVKSNAILVAKNKVTTGIGAGQMNRVGSAKIAMDWAKSQGATSMVLASDAFFPFDDTVRLAKEYGVTAIIQPGGSIRDEDSINACN